MKRRFNLVDLTGQRFSRLLVLREAPSRIDSCGKLRTWWLCRCDCGVEKEVIRGHLMAGSTVSCGCLRQERLGHQKGKTGRQSPSYRGGRRLNKEGYVLLLRPTFPGHEKYINRYVTEHTVVMARHLGRALREEESVHHKNGVRDDNRIENLELWAKGHRAGQRVEDLVAWAKEILTRYGPGTPPKIISPCCV